MHKVVKFATTNIIPEISQVHNVARFSEVLHKADQTEGQWLISDSFQTFFQNQNPNLNFENKRNYIEIYTARQKKKKKVVYFNILFNRFNYDYGMH